MTADPDAIRALLGEAESAHGVYEATELNGVYDEAWPRWYAAYAVEHGIGSLLGRDVTVDELAGLLSSAWDAFREADPKPPEGWGAFTARRLAAES